MLSVAVVVYWLVMSPFFCLSFQGQFASSEKENEVLRNEIDTLKQQLMEANEKNQIILAKEGALKEEKQKVEQQLLVASSDQVC